MLNEIGEDEASKALATGDGRSRSNGDSRTRKKRKAHQVLLPSTAFSPAPGATTTKKDHYYKHIPLIMVDSDDDEDHDQSRSVGMFSFWQFCSNADNEHIFIFCLKVTFIRSVLSTTVFSWYRGQKMCLYGQTEPQRLAIGKIKQSYWLRAIKKTSSASFEALCCCFDLPSWGTEDRSVILDKTDYFTIVNCNLISHPMNSWW